MLLAMTNMNIVLLLNISIWIFSMQLQTQNILSKLIILASSSPSTPNNSIPKSYFLHLLNISEIYLFLSPSPPHSVLATISLSFGPLHQIPNRSTNVHSQSPAIHFLQCRFQNANLITNVSCYSPNSLPLTTLVGLNPFDGF